MISRNSPSTWERASNPESSRPHSSPWFLVTKKFTFAKGDPITVTGTKAKWEEKVAELAREIKKGHESLILRGARGRRWSGPKRR